MNLWAVLSIRRLTPCVFIKWLKTQHTTVPGSALTLGVALTLDWTTCQCYLPNKADFPVLFQAVGSSWDWALQRNTLVCSTQSEARAACGASVKGYRVLNVAGGMWAPCHAGRHQNCPSYRRAALPEPFGKDRQLTVRYPRGSWAVWLNAVICCVCSF